MNAKTLTLLSVVTLGFGALAVYVVTGSRPETTAQAKAGTPLFAGLRERVNDVAAVRVTTADETYTLERGEAGWGLREKGGYPVDVDKVKALVVGVSELELVEEKTGNPALFARLGVQDPGAEGDAPSKRVELLDAGGATLADLVVGRDVQARGAGERHLYVRRSDGGPALEASGRVRVDEGSSALLDREIAKLERKRVARVTTVHPDGEVLRVERPSPDVADFTVADLPEGAELSWPGVAGGVAGALEYLSLEDVRPADSPFDEAAAVRTRFEAFDGLVVETESLDEEGRVVLRVHASFEPSLRQAEPVGPPDAEGEAPAAPDLKPAEEVEAEVAEINARVGRWLYVVPGYAGSNLRKRLTDLLAQPEAQAEPLLPLEPAEPVETLEEGGDDGHADHDHAPATEQVEPVEPVEDSAPEAPAEDDGGGR